MASCSSDGNSVSVCISTPSGVEVKRDIVDFPEIELFGKCNRSASMRECECSRDLDSEKEQELCEKPRRAAEPAGLALEEANDSAFLWRPDADKLSSDWKTPTPKQSDPALVQIETEAEVDAEAEAIRRSRRDLVWLKNFGFDAITQWLAHGQEVPIDAIDTISFMSERQKGAVRRRISTVNESIRKRQSLETASLLGSSCNVAGISSSSCDQTGQTNGNGNASSNGLLSVIPGTVRRHSALGLMTPISVKLPEAEAGAGAGAEKPTITSRAKQQDDTVSLSSLTAKRSMSMKKERKRRKSSKRIDVVDTTNARCGDSENENEGEYEKEVERRVFCGAFSSPSGSFKRRMANAANADSPKRTSQSRKASKASVVGSPTHRSRVSVVTVARQSSQMLLSIPRIAITFENAIAASAASVDDPNASPTTPTSTPAFTRIIANTENTPQSQTHQVQVDEEEEEGEIATATTQQSPLECDEPCDQSSRQEGKLSRFLRLLCRSQRQQSNREMCERKKRKHALALAPQQQQQQQERASRRRLIISALRRRLRIARRKPSRSASDVSNEQLEYDLADVINTRWQGEFLGAETNFLPVSQLAPMDDYVWRVCDCSSASAGSGAIESHAASQYSQLPDYELIEHGCGITLISDLRPGSKETLAQVEELRRFVLLELTGLFDEHEIRCKTALPDLCKHVRWTTAFRKQKEHQNVFGASLWSLLEADAAFVRRELQQTNSSSQHDVTASSSDCSVRVDESVSSGVNLSVPAFLRRLVAHLRAYCLCERGLFRIAAQASRVRALMQTIDEEFYRTDSRFNLADHLRNKPHDAADLLKKFLKKLHSPLLTRELIGAFRAVGRIRDVRTQVEALNMLMLLLPEPNRNTLLLLLSLLDDVARNAASNKMTLHNVATVFAPTILYGNRDGFDPQAGVGQNIAASAIALGATPTFLACSRSVSSNSLASMANAVPRNQPNGGPCCSSLMPVSHAERSNTVSVSVNVSASVSGARLNRAMAQSTENLPVSAVSVSRSSSTIINPSGESQVSLAANTDIVVVKVLIHYHRLLAVVPSKFTMQLRAYLRLHYLVSDMPPLPRVPDAKRLSCTIAQRLNAAFANSRLSDAHPDASTQNQSAGQDDSRSASICLPKRTPVHAKTGQKPTDDVCDADSRRQGNQTQIRRPFRLFRALRDVTDNGFKQPLAGGCTTSEGLVASLEIERRRNGEVYPLIIRVHAPSLGLCRKMIDVSMKPKVREIIERFFCSTSPRSRLRYLALPKAATEANGRKKDVEITEDDAGVKGPILNDCGVCLPDDVNYDGQHITYLYEAGAGIGEMRLDPDANMWDVYLRNPLARWIVK